MYDFSPAAIDSMHAGSGVGAILSPDMDVPELPIEERILRLLRRISRAVDLHSRQLSLQQGLTGPQIVCLRELRKSDRLTPSELAQRVSLSQATVSGILDRLEARHLVQRERNPDDKRRVFVWLTERGLEAVSLAPQPLQTRFARRLGGIPFDEQTRIEQALERIVGMMEEAEELAMTPSSDPEGGTRK